MLQGSEVKSLRLGQVQLADAFARVPDGELWLDGVHIAPYQFANGRSVPTIPTAAASCCCTATRSTGCRPASPRSGSRSSRCACTSGTARRRSSWAWPRVARRATSARPSPSATPAGDRAALGRQRKGIE